jgi:hypothetical protein
MLTATVELIDDGSGIEQMAQLFQCTCTPDSDVFHVFMPANGHLHFQCVQCEQTYCPYVHECVIPRQEPNEAVEGLHQG